MTTDRGAVLARIKALSAKTLARGCTRPEAAAAYAKASALMDAHGVSEAELRDEPVLPPPVFDREQYARECEQATRDYEARQHRERRNGALGIAAMCLVMFGLLFAGNLLKLGPAEGLLQALWRTASGE